MPKGIPEAPELDVGVTLEERDSVLSMMPHFTLGPLDLCCTRKSGTSSIVGVITGGTEERGYFHRVAGSDVSSIAAISAYLFDLVNRQQQSSVWKEGGSLQLRGGVFCVCPPPPALPKFGRTRPRSVCSIPSPHFPLSLFHPSKHLAGSWTRIPTVMTRSVSSAVGRIRQGRSGRKASRS